MSRFLISIEILTNNLLNQLTQEEMRMIKFTRPICVDSVGSVFIKCRGENYLAPGQTHPHWEMVYVIDGYVGITAGERIIKCRPGSLIFHQPDEFHRLWNAGKGTINIMIVTFTAKGEWMDKLRSKMIFPDEKERGIIQRLQEIIIENAPNDESDKIATETFHNDNATTAQFISLFEYFLYACAKSENIIAPKMTGDALLFSAAVAKMESYIERSVTIKEFADELNISQSHLKRLFQRYALTGVHDYFLTMKINRAKVLLSQGESVRNTALAVGFTDQNYFSIAFKRATGVSPSKWWDKE